MTIEIEDCRSTLDLAEPSLVVICKQDKDASIEVSFDDLQTFFKNKNKGEKIWKTKK